MWRPHVGGRKAKSGLGCAKAKKQGRMPKGKRERRLERRLERWEGRCEEVGGEVEEEEEEREEGGGGGRGMRGEGNVGGRGGGYLRGRG